MKTVSENNGVISWPALDLIKCACVIGMILLHCFYWVMTVYGKLVLSSDNPIIPWISRFMFLGFLPLMLPLTAGCAFRLQLSPDSDLRRLPGGRYTGTLAGSVFLILSGYCMNVAAGGWVAAWSWNVLQFAGLSFALIGMLLSLASIPAVAFAGLGVLVVYATSIYGTTLTRSSEYVGQILLGDPSGFNSWPVFPWFATIVFGFLLGHTYLVLPDRKRFSAFLAVSAALCLAGSALSGRWMPELDHLSLFGGSVFSPHPGVILALLGLSCLGFLAADRLAAAFPLHPRGFVNCFSKGILWIYIIHLTIGCRMDLLLRDATGTDAWFTALGNSGKACAIVGFPVGLLLLSWLVGYLSIRLLHETRFRLHLRKVE